MTRTLLVRGLLAGLVAGLVAFVVASLVGEPAVAGAIALEHAGAEAAGHAHDEVELVSRSVQSTLGLLTATVVFSTALGGVLGIAVAFARGRTWPVGDRALVCWLAAAGFVTTGLVPLLKYPANPPSVGDSGTLQTRTGLFFGMIALSLLFAVAGVWVARRVTRWSRWDRALAGIGTYFALTVLAVLVLPDATPVVDFPAQLLWEFRLGSLATQLAVWTTLGLVLGALTERVTTAERQPQPVR